MTMEEESIRLQKITPPPSKSLLDLDVKELYDKKLRSKMIKMRMDAESIRCKDPHLSLFQVSSGCEGAM